MELLIGYGLFSLTTGIASLLILFLPVMEELRVDQPLNPIAQSPALSYMSFLCMSLIAAPVIFWACIFPNAGDKFKEALLKSVKD